MTSIFSQLAQGQWKLTWCIWRAVADLNGSQCSVHFNKTNWIIRSEARLVIRPSRKRQLWNTESLRCKQLPSWATTEPWRSNAASETPAKSTLTDWCGSVISSPTGIISSNHHFTMPLHSWCFLLSPRFSPQVQILHRWQWLALC